MGFFDYVLFKLGYVPIAKLISLESDFQHSVAQLSGEAVTLEQANAGRADKLAVLLGENDNFREQAGYYLHANAQFVMWQQNLEMLLGARGVSLQMLLEWDVRKYSPGELQTPQELSAALRAMPDIYIAQFAEPGKKGRTVAFNALNGHRIELPAGNTNYGPDRAIRIFAALGIENRLLR